MLERLVYAKSFGAAGCGNALFASLGAYREFGGEVRGQQAAIVARRAAVFNGEDPELAKLALGEELAGLGMDDDTIADHLANPNLDVDGLFVQASDL